MELLDVDKLSVTRPHRIYSKPSLLPLEVTKVTIVSWMLLGVYYTRDVLHSYGRCEDSHCILCKDVSISPAVELLSHMLLQCPALGEVAILWR